MTHRIVNYQGDNTGRRAINDLIRWFGLTRSKVLFRELRNAKSYKAKHPDWDLYTFLSEVCIVIDLNGVVGEPVRRLFAYIFGEEELEKWLMS